MVRQPVYIRRTHDGNVYWISVPAIVVRISVWCVLAIPAIVLALLVKYLLIGGV